MSTPFHKTLVFLERDERRAPPRLAFASLLLLALWSAWLTCTHTTVYAVAQEGRLLAAGAASPVQSPVAGVIATTSLALGAEVSAGDPLVVLDASAEELRREEERTRIRGIAQAIEAVEQILAAERRLAVASAKVGASRVGSAYARAKVAEEVTALSRQQDEAMRRLRAQQLASGLEALKAAEDMQRQRGQLLISGADTALAAADLDRVRGETEVRLLTLQRELTELTARAAAARSVVAQLDWQIAQRTLRAPVDGVVADVVPLPKGAAVAPNQALATIVPRAKMRWVAKFSPRDAVGRIKPGQRARVRLDAFPWTAYGAVHARVVSVGSEPREQRVRVELEIVDAPRNIPLSHGMTGVTDVEVEEVSPLRLLLRLAGQRAEAPSPAPKSAPPADAEPIGAL